MLFYLTIIWHLFQLFEKLVFDSLVFGNFSLTIIWDSTQFDVSLNDFYSTSISLIWNDTKSIICFHKTQFCVKLWQLLSQYYSSSWAATAAAASLQTFKLKLVLISTAASYTLCWIRTYFKVVEMSACSTAPNKWSKSLWLVELDSNITIESVHLR